MYLIQGVCRSPCLCFIGSVTIAIVANCEFSVVKIDFDSLLILLHNSQCRSLNERFFSSDELIVHRSFSFVAIANRL